jgi:hypothetical protein
LFTFIADENILLINFLGAFEKLRKATITCGVSVLMEQPGSHWTDLIEIWYLGSSKINRKNSSLINI